MLFNSPEFIFLFLPLVFIGFFAVARWSHGAAAAWLAAASLGFYAWWSVAAVPLLLGSIAANYALGLAVTPGQGRSDRARRAWLVAGIAFNLGLLGYFKYADFFIANANALLALGGFKPWPALELVLPLGISFYTFTQIAFVVDCWQGKVRERSAVHYLLFVTFFPHLIAGPILHHSQMMPQFRAAATYRINLAAIASGVTLFWIGLAKKVVIADGLADFVNTGFDHARTGTIGFVDGWALALSYTLQLYFDFSGYTDMALGAALLFGITLPQNFASPYKARSIIDFWRRWHMTLSAFLRDYLYIPLGGNRRGPARRFVNVMLTMVLGGLWHGASWTFVAWGAAHGVLLVFNHGWRWLRGGREGASGVWAWALTFAAVTLAWVVFRADSLATAGAIYAGMLGLNGVPLPAAIAALLPFRPDFVHVVGTMPALGGGALMGTFEQLALIALGLGVALFGREAMAMPLRWRLTVVVLTAGFVVHSLFFAVPKQFMYFQF